MAQTARPLNYSTGPVMERMRVMADLAWQLGVQHIDLTPLTFDYHRGTLHKNLESLTHDLVDFSRFHTPEARYETDADPIISCFKYSHCW